MSFKEVREKFRFVSYIRDLVPSELPFYYKNIILAIVMSIIVLSMFIEDVGKPIWEYLLLIPIFIRILYQSNDLRLANIFIIISIVFVRGVVLKDLIYTIILLLFLFVWVLLLYFFGDQVLEGNKLENKRRMKEIINENRILRLLYKPNFIEFSSFICLYLYVVQISIIYREKIVDSPILLVLGLIFFALYSLCLMINVALYRIGESIEIDIKLTSGIIGGEDVLKSLSYYKLKTLYNVCTLNRVTFESNFDKYYIEEVKLRKSNVIGGSENQKDSIILVCDKFTNNEEFHIADIILKDDNNKKRRYKCKFKVEFQRFENSVIATRIEIIYITKLPFVFYTHKSVSKNTKVDVEKILPNYYYNSNITDDKENNIFNYNVTDKKIIFMDGKYGIGKTNATFRFIINNGYTPICIPVWSNTFKSDPLYFTYKKASEYSKRASIFSISKTKVNKSVFTLMIVSILTFISVAIIPIYIQVKETFKVDKKINSLSYPVIVLIIMSIIIFVFVIYIFCKKYQYDYIIYKDKKTQYYSDGIYNELKNMIVDNKLFLIFEDIDRFQYEENNDKYKDVDTFFRFLNELSRNLIFLNRTIGVVSFDNDVFDDKSGNSDQGSYLNDIKDKVFITETFFDDIIDEEKMKREYLINIFQLLSETSKSQKVAVDFDVLSKHYTMRELHDIITKNSIRSSREIEEKLIKEFKNMEEKINKNSAENLLNNTTNKLLSKVSKLIGRKK
ncbi:MAG: hypothetical protein RR543_04005 [Erysipelotrichales bacterium]